MSERAPETLLWDFLRGALTTKALAIVADLRIADALVAGPRPVTELARTAGVDADALHRLLRALASDSARPGARVLATETVIQPGNEQEGAKWLDLLMLALSGGRERTEPEWRALLEGAGLEPVEIADGLVQARCP
jgi:hypothetical protein